MKSKNILLIQAAPGKEQAHLWFKRMGDKMQDMANMGNIWSTGGAELGPPNARFSHFWSLPTVKPPLTLGMVIFLGYLPLSQHTDSTDIPFSLPSTPPAPHISAHLGNPERVSPSFAQVLFQILSQRLDIYIAKQITSGRGERFTYTWRYRVKCTDSTK